MYFSASGVEVAPWIPPLVAFGISLLTASGGLSGAVLLLPYQMSCLGYLNPSVSATNHFFNVVAIPSGVYRYCREGRMVWPLAWLIVVGTLPGAWAGALIRIRLFPDPDHFRLFAACVLFYLGLRLWKELTQGAHKKVPEKEAKESDRANENSCSDFTVTQARLTWKRLSYLFQGDAYSVSTTGLFLFSLLVGLVGGIYGIGGGAILVPFLVSVFKLPVHSVAGATLMGTCVTSAASVVFYRILAPFHPELPVAPDWILGALFGIGGVCGMYVGARLQKHLPPRVIKGVLCAILFMTAIRYVFESLSLGGLND